LSKISPAYFLILVLVTGTMSPVFSNAFAEESDIFPSWVKNVFKFWANGDVTDTDLKNALEFLLREKIIDLEKKTTISVKQETSVTINDDNFFTTAQKNITGWIKVIKNNPTADLLAKSALPVIPVVGPLLANLYDNAPGTTTDKNNAILKVLENMENMNEDQLKKAFTKLDENKAAIEKNTYKLDDLLTDTKQILVITTDTNVRVKSLEAKLDQVLLQLSNIKSGKKSVEVSSDLKNQLNEITQLSSKIIENDPDIIKNIKIETELDFLRLEALAKSFALLGDYDSALKISEQILQSDSKNYVALYEKAWALYDLGKFSESNTAFDEFLKHYPQDTDGWAGKGWSLLELGSYYLDEAKASFTKAVGFDESNIDARAGLGWTYLEQDNCEMAESVFNEILSVDQYNEDALAGLDEIEYGDYC